MSEAAFAPVQTFETTVGDRLSGLLLRFLIVPSRAIVEHGLLSEPEPLLSSLGLENSGRVEPDQLVAALRFVSGTEKASLQPFLDYCISAPIIPFEESPLDAKSIADILHGAGGVGIGAYFGVVVAGGATPLLLITVPAGMIICGAAAGVARALEIGLQARILRLLGVSAEASANT